MGRRLYAWVVVALLGLRPTIEMLEALRPTHTDHAAHLQMPDEGPHEQVPTVVSDPPLPPPVIPTVLDAASRLRPHRSDELPPSRLIFPVGFPGVVQVVGRDDPFAPYR